MISSKKSKAAAFVPAENQEPKCLFELFGLSTDEKPVVFQGALVANGSKFFEMDTSKRYVFDEENQEWLQFTFCDGGGGSKVAVVGTAIVGQSTVGESPAPV